MKRTRKLMIAAAVLAVLALTAVTAYAQQGGNGRGGNGGNGSNGTGACLSTNCLSGTAAQNGTAQGGMMNGSSSRWGSETGTSGYGGAQGNAGNLRGTLGYSLPPATAGELPDDVIAAMTAGIMDEYHAQAVYQSVIDQFGAVRPFTSILNAETQHVAAWEFMFDRYGLTVPEAPAFEVPQFATLADACAAGAAAEIANMDLYDSWLETVSTYPDIAQVVTSLRDVSQNSHLPAFEQCAGL